MREGTTLEKIQKIAKIVFIVCKVVMICSIVAACLNLVGIISVALGFNKLVENGMNLVQGLVKEEVDLSSGKLYAYMATTMIMLVVSAIVAWFAMDYLDEELEEGTPFTYDGSRRVFRLGLISIIVSVIGATISSLVVLLLENFYSISSNDVDVSNESFLVLGVFCLLMSLIFRYGAEISGEKDEKTEIEKIEK